VSSENAKSWEQPLSGSTAIPARERPVHDLRRKRTLQLCASAILLPLVALAGWVQVATFQGNGMLWHDWTFDPVVVLLTALLCLVYGIGAARGTASVSPLQRWRHVAFAAGIVVTLLALESPLGVLAHQLFLARQLQDLLLGIVAPILIVLAAPGAALIDGLAAGRAAGAPAARAGGNELRADSWPRIAAVTALSIVVLYVWLYPPFKNQTVTNPLAGIALSATIFAAALLFWGHIFDFSPLPAGAGYGKRIMMLWISALAHIGVGAYLTMKTEILYLAYGAATRSHGISALTDETVGGFVIWVPSALLCLAAAILVIHLWGRHEDRIWAEHSGWSSSNSAALLFPTTGAALIEVARPKNRAQAIAVAAFVIAVFGMTIFSGVLNQLNARRGHHQGPLVAQHGTQRVW
jgi:putative membrane protein